MKVEHFRAWAIDTKSNEGHGFIGRYWNFENVFHLLPVHLEGCKIALFSTRKTALENLPKVRRGAFPKARVVRVSVTIKAS
jgi:hypothetical protein